MNQSNLAKAAQNAGFDRIYGNQGSDLYLLDKDTDGSVGRAIYIKGSLTSKFEGMADDDINNVFHALKKLRSNAGNINSYSNTQNAEQHFSIFGKSQVTYEIKQHYGVIITDIDLANFTDTEAGIYDVLYDDNKFNFNKHKKNTISKEFIAINGLCDNALQAAETIMPKLIKKAYSSSGIESNGYNLFYNPPHLYQKGFKWATPSQKKCTENTTSERLQEAFTSAKNKSVNWTVHGDGIKVLNRALKGLKGQDFSKHTIMFMAPRGVLSETLPLMRDAKINLHKDIVKANDHDLKSQYYLLKDRNTLSAEVDKFNNQELSDEGAILQNKIRNKTMGIAFGAIGSAISVATLSLKAAVTFPLKQAYTDTPAAHKLRNIMANNLTDPSYNPHLNPDLDVDHLNMQALRAAGTNGARGTIGQTFRQVLKAQFTRKA